MTFLRLLWTVHGLCQCWRQRMMARLKMQQATEKIQRMTWRLDTLEDTFTRQRRLISLIYFFFSSHICYSRRRVELWLGKTVQREAIFPSRPVRLEGSDGEKVALYVLVAGSLCLNNECVPVLSQVTVGLVSEIWREERACRYLPTPVSHSGEWAIWTGPQWTVETGRVNQWGDIFFLTKETAAAVLQLLDSSRWDISERVWCINILHHIVLEIFIVNVQRGTRQLFLLWLSAIRSFPKEFVQNRVKTSRRLRRTL